MNRKISKTVLSMMVAALIACIAMPVQAKVSAEVAEKLKNELTPTGAERGGNKEGTIPPWTGGLSKVPENVYFDPSSKAFLADPFAEDKVLFTITTKNVDQYKDKLSQGVLELFKRYADTWKMHVYPTRRSAAFSEEIYKSTYENALTAEVVDSDGSMQNFYKGFPFPIPQNGEEVISNFRFRPNGGKVIKFNGTGGVIQEDGSRNKAVVVQQRFFNVAEGVPKEKFDPKDYISGFLVEFLTTGRKGEIYLVKSRGDYRKDDPAGAWTYMPGQRRVRRSPNMLYDGVDPVNGNLMVMDDSFMYQGPIDRFDWKLTKEKKEMFVAYNTYQLELQPSLDSVIKPQHIDPEYVRWELHRTWVVVATLKEGSRHIYGKRVFYMDEDSWQILLKDQYDNRGVLWRASFACGKQYYHMPAYRQSQYMNFDFQTRCYIAANFFTERPIVEDVPLSMFTIQYLRKMGKR